VQTALNGVKMELEDATYPLLKGCVTTGDAKVPLPNRQSIPTLCAFSWRFECHYRHS